MYEVSKIETNLPATLPELAKYALIGREKLTAVKAEIKAIQKVGLAKEVLEQKRAEAQEIAELVTMSEVKIGAMLKEIPKATKGTGANQYKVAEFHPKEDFSKSKAETVKELGFTKKQTEQFQKMADNEATVMQAIEEARENDDIISRNAVLKKIDEAKKPFIVNNSGNNEWYTPREFIEAARDVMGSIDTDPATSETAQRTVLATTYYTVETNGLDKEWEGNVWMNPPYASGLIEKFCEKVVEEYGCGNAEQAIVLVNNATETTWFRTLTRYASAVCFPTSRIKFYMENGKAGSPLQGQAFIYFGDNKEKFIEVFSTFGWCAEVRA